jgi:hypothetical protein
MVDLRNILCGIGRNLIGLTLMDVYVEAVDLIVKQCPNLQYLELMVVGVGEEGTALITLALKRWLKNLAKLKLDGKTIRLGTDWKGV